MQTSNRVFELTSNWVNWVVSTIHSGSSSAVDEEWKVTLVLMLYHKLLQLFRDHLAPVNTKHKWINSVQNTTNIREGEIRRIMEYGARIKVKSEEGS